MRLDAPARGPGARDEALERGGEVPAAAAGAELEDPGEDGGGRGADEAGAVVDHGCGGDEGVAGIRGQGGGWRHWRRQLVGMAGWGGS